MKVMLHEHLPSPEKLIEQIDFEILAKQIQLAVQEEVQEVGDAKLASHSIDSVIVVNPRIEKLNPTITSEQYSEKDTNNIQLIYTEKFTLPEQKDLTVSKYPLNRTDIIKNYESKSEGENDNFIKKMLNRQLPKLQSEDQEYNIDNRIGGYKQCQA